MKMCTSPADCNGQKCDSETGVCVCEPGFNKGDCSISTCNPVYDVIAKEYQYCSGSGTCTKAPEVSGNFLPLDTTVIAMLASMATHAKVMIAPMAYLCAPTISIHAIVRLSNASASPITMDQTVARTPVALSTTVLGTVLLSNAMIVARVVMMVLIMQPVTATKGGSALTAA